MFTLSAFWPRLNLLRVCRVFQQFSADSGARIACATVALALVVLSASWERASAQCASAPAGVENCTGAVPSANFNNPPVNTLNVNNLSGDSGGGISLKSIGADGDDPGNPGNSVTINFTDPAHSVITSGGTIGVLGQSQGGKGENGTVAVDTPGIGGGAGLVTIVTQGPVHSDGAAAVEGISLGGNGGNGGGGQDGRDGGSTGGVTITASGAIVTTSANAAGIYALSRGGRGGDGKSLGFVGDGAAGGFAGAVSITTLAGGSIVTNGDNSSGIIGQSIGGGGGSGGDGAAFESGAPGGAAEGGKVTINTADNITTNGFKSFGILAQSIGGGGGGGGFQTTLFQSSGGDAGSGGNGSDVTIVTAAGTTIKTAGPQASAIYVQSIGGGGGSGNGAFGLFSASGGNGSQGGSGGNVKITNAAALTATHDQSDGIFAQSIGGSGGAGGTAAGLTTFGGNGGAGQNAGTVTIINSGKIAVSGNANFLNTGANSTLAAGIFAQSVGGGGGDAGIAVAGIVNFGGRGGAAGFGNTVSVTNSAVIDAECGNTCSGGNAIFAQSVGGGGGNGGGSIGIVNFGGDGGGGGDGGAVIVNNSSSDPNLGLKTTAQNSSAIFAQSIGGGGGNGSFALGIVSIGGTGGVGGKGGNVTVNNSARIETTGSDSAGIFAQSVGGGGGNGGGSVAAGLFGSFALGGKGANAQDGGTVCVNTGPTGPNCTDGQATTTGAIKTGGDRSTGILAQSIGGGGGNGGFAISASAGLYGNVAIGAGGDGAKGGAGGLVFVGGGGSITTGSFNSATNVRIGQFSDGIDAQSVGGGGGNGGFSITGSVSTGAAVGGSIGGSGGDGNNGNTVTVSTHYNIETFGDQATGLFARSIGGGGGDGGFAIAVSGSPYASVSLCLWRRRCSGRRRRHR